MEPSCTSNLMNPISLSRLSEYSTLNDISVLLKFEENLKDEHNMQIVNRPLSSFITRSISSCSSENSGIAFDFLFESDSRAFRYKPSVPKRRKQYISAANKSTRLRHYISQTAAHTAFSWTENGGLRTHDIEWTAAMNCTFKTPYDNYNPTNICSEAAHELSPAFSWVSGWTFD